MESVIPGCHASSRDFGVLIAVHDMSDFISTSLLSSGAIAGAVCFKLSYPKFSQAELGFLDKWLGPGYLVSNNFIHNCILGVSHLLNGNL